jgi:glutathione S-transferase
LWLLEELGLAYEVKRYARDPATRMGPPELKQAHPLGKSPTVEIDGKAMAESGAIVEFLAEREAGGKLAVRPGESARRDYLYWLHFAESSVMPAIIMRYFLNRIGEAGAAQLPMVEAQIDLLLGYADRALAGGDYFAAGRFSAADVQMSAASDAAASFGMGEKYPNLARVRASMRARPAFARALERGGP